MTKDFKGKATNLSFTPADKWILSRVNSLKKEASEALENYQFSKALNPVRDFFWLEFADYYIEEVKHRIYNKKDKTRKAAQFTLQYVLTDCLKMLAPFLPHITEEIMQSFFKEKLKKKSIHLEEWPKAEEKKINKYYEELGKTMNEIISALRKYKSGNGLPLNTEVKKATVFLKGKELLKKIEEAREEIRKTMNVTTLDVLVAEAPEKAIEVSEGIKIEVNL